MQEMAKQTKVKTKQMKSEKNEYREFGGPFGVFFMYLTVPILPLVVITSCSDNMCEVGKVCMFFFKLMVEN